MDGIRQLIEHSQIQYICQCRVPNGTAMRLTTDTGYPVKGYIVLLRMKEKEKEKKE